MSTRGILYLIFSQVQNVCFIKKIWKSMCCQTENGNNAGVRQIPISFFTASWPFVFLDE
jgi:hypothetical protein